ncbi:flagellar basal body rod protein FlgF [Aliikangiella coralliicola]|uniref:Flagellar basal-body rod protein FlgF n=1 Tax=Aliikangiella coralliicola TaxID=2592383 RepID=A0A545U5W8_9GAMM|nr:flagellar basal body rod protein FlgF [Aliikangiella coralliicola]TQV84869.1 flagellar basal body rod protein FlgF [Aliikangiella coralliicola]
MDNMLYISMTGARETSLAQATTANNLANANTTAFKADLAQFRSMPVYGEGLPSRAFAMTERPGYNFDAGSAVTTGRSLDISIRGEGWFVVHNEQGEELLSRRGDLKITPNGALLNGANQPIVGDGGPIALPPFEKIDIAKDGTITILPLGAEANATAIIDRIKMVNPDISTLEKNREGLFISRNNEPFIADAAVSLESGVLEGSNVSVVEELTNMISLSRQFEVQVKLMSSVEERGRSLDRLLQP